MIVVVVVVVVVVVIFRSSRGGGTHLHMYGELYCGGCGGGSAVEPRICLPNHEPRI